MAGGKLSARQKMINLMYLVFIAMIALTTSKEVLSAFGLMDAKFEATNSLATNANLKTLDGLNKKAEEKPEEFAVAANKAKQISSISDSFYRYLNALKADIIKGGGYEIDSETGELPSEDMDKGAYLDELWFKGDGLKTEGSAVMDRIKKYKDDVKAVLGDDVSSIKVLENFEERFDINDIKPKEGLSKNWLDYHFKGFPAIASHTKLTALQSDIKVTEADLYNLFLGNTLTEAVTLKNYQAIVLADKSAFFAGENFQGKVVLGKYANVTPIRMKIGDQEIDLTNAIDSLGAAKLNFNVGNVGEHEIKGEFTFLEDGKELPIPITGNYVVVPRPNSATISADKMNVVYRGVTNPMTISFAGVPDNKVSATGAGLTRGTGTGKYNMVPGSGSEVTISVTAKLDDGKSVGDKKTFRIKDIPKPTGKIVGIAQGKLPRNNVEIGRVESVLEDFDFNLPLTVTSFKFKVPGQPSVTCQGNRLNGQAKGALRKARRGATVTIFDIKARSNGPIIKPATPVVIELSN